MALLFPRVIKSCTLKMTSDPCSLRQKKKKILRETHKKGHLSVVPSPQKRNTVNIGKYSHIKTRMIQETP